MHSVVKNTSRRLTDTGTFETGSAIISQAEARGSLSETQYFIHLAGRLGYFSAAEVAELHAQTKVAFGCLHGLIKAVEQETGKISRVIATMTSLLVIGLIRCSGSPLSALS